MKIALCLFGEPRYVANEVAANLYKEFIINKYDVDIFGHTWISDTYTPSSWNGQKEIKGIDNPHDIVRYQYQGIKLKADLVIPFDDDDRDRNNVLSQAYSINESLNLIPDPDQYRFIILGRYDLILTRFAPLDDLLPGFYSTNRHPVYADQLVFASPKYLRAYKFVTEVVKEKRIPKEISIEEFKLEHFKNLFPGERVMVHDFSLSLIRNL